MDSFKMKFCHRKSRETIQKEIYKYHLCQYMNKINTELGYPAILLMEQKDEIGFICTPKKKDKEKLKKIIPIIQKKMMKECPF